MSQYDDRPSPPYAQPVARVTPQVEAPGATAGLVFGILSIAMSMPVLGLVFAYIGYTKSKEARRVIAAYPGAYSGEGIAQAGYVCSIIGLVIGGLSTFCGCAYFAFVILMFAGVIAGAGAGGASGY